MGRVIAAASGGRINAWLGTSRTGRRWNGGRRIGRLPQIDAFGGAKWGALDVSLLLMALTFISGCWSLASLSCRSNTKVVWNLSRSRIEWIRSNNNLCCEDKNNERQHLPLDSKQPAFQGAG